MSTLDPARVKPGVTPESLPDRSGDTAGQQGDDLIRGRALVFWDPMSLPGTKFATVSKASALSIQSNSNCIFICASF